MFIFFSVSIIIAVITVIITFPVSIIIVNSHAFGGAYIVDQEIGFGEFFLLFHGVGDLQYAFMTEVLPYKVES